MMYLLSSQRNSRCRQRALNIDVPLAVIASQLRGDNTGPWHRGVALRYRNRMCDEASLLPWLSRSRAWGSKCSFPQCIHLRCLLRSRSHKRGQMSISPHHPTKQNQGATSLLVFEWPWNQVKESCWTNFSYVKVVLFPLAPQFISYKQPFYEDSNLSLLCADSLNNVHWAPRGNSRKCHRKCLRDGNHLKSFVRILISYS
jgi:hypothetical protein